MLFCFLLVLPSCAYRLGDGPRALPDGYDRVAIPVFANKTDEVGIEIYFTNALIREFSRSKIARVVSHGEAPVTILGSIEKLTLTPTSQVASGNSSGVNLPDGAVLTTEYRLNLKAKVSLKRNSDLKILWSQDFDNEKVFPAAQIGSQFINSANPLYNHSAVHQNVANLAQLMMYEAYSRMTERF